MATLSTETPSGVTRRRLARIATEVLAPWVWVLGLPLIVAWKVTGYHPATIERHAIGSAATYARYIAARAGTSPASR